MVTHLSDMRKICSIIIAKKFTFTPLEVMFHKASIKKGTP